MIGTKRTFSYLNFGYGFVLTILSVFVAEGVCQLFGLSVIMHGEPDFAWFPLMAATDALEQHAKEDRTSQFWIERTAVFMISCVAALFVIALIVDTPVMNIPDPARGIIMFLPAIYVAVLPLMLTTERREQRSWKKLLLIYYPAMAIMWAVADWGFDLLFA